MIRISHILLISIYCISCSDFSNSTTEQYFEDTFNLIKENSVKKNEIEWDHLLKTVRDSINHLESNYDVHRAIGYTVRLINDGHTIFRAPQQGEKSPPINSNKTQTKNEIPPIKTELLDNEIGYIKLKGLNIIGNDSLQNAYPIEIRKALLALDLYKPISGWVIDLRSHGGGILSSESLGLSPLFSNSLIGITWNNKNEFDHIICTNSEFRFGNKLIDSLSYDSTLNNSNKKVAVLVSINTVSAGEFLALAFSFQEQARLFGEKTRGKTSHLRMFNLKDGAVLLLAVAYDCDPNGNIVKDGIVPDEICEPEESLSKAISWIKDTI